MASKKNLYHPANSSSAVGWALGMLLTGVALVAGVASIGNSVGIGGLRGGIQIQDNGDFIEKASIGDLFSGGDLFSNTALREPIQNNAANQQAFDRLSYEDRQHLAVSFPNCEHLLNLGLTVSQYAELFEICDGENEMVELSFNSGNDGKTAVNGLVGIVQSGRTVATN